MTSKREELDNNKEMNKLLKDNSSKMEIAKEIQSNKIALELVVPWSNAIIYFLSMFIPPIINFKPN